jgi:hypothetical protein
VKTGSQKQDRAKNKIERAKNKIELETMKRRRLPDEVPDRRTGLCFISSNRACLMSYKKRKLPGEAQQSP